MLSTGLAWGRELGKSDGILRPASHGKGHVSRFFGPQLADLQRGLTVVLVEKALGARGRAAGARG